MRLPFCRVEFATLGSHPEPVSAQVIRAGFSHEILILKFRDRNLSSRNYRSDLPIRVSWGIFPQYREEFVGYVHHVRPDIERAPGASMVPLVELVAVGPTRVLRNETPQSWGATRSDLVVRALARAWGLEADVDRSPVTRESLMQPASSGWEFLTALAKEDGLHLSSSGTRVHLWNLEQRAADLRKHAAVFARSDGHVKRFMPTSGETNPSEDAEAVLRGVYALDSGGKLTAARSDHTPPTLSRTAALEPTVRFSQIDTGVVAGTPAGARQHLQATARRSGRIFTARADLVAFPRLRAGDQLVLTGYGATHSGYWHVDRVEFSLQQDGISSTADLSRANAVDDGQRPSTPTGKSKHRKPWTAELVSGVWVDRSWK